MNKKIENMQITDKNQEIVLNEFVEIEKNLSNS
jgi:hypothetical protein